MNWKPSNTPGQYNEARVLQLKPITQALLTLKLPPARQRKLNPIVSALIMQVEDGGDSPEVNSLLLTALQAGVRHQVDKQQAKPIMSAIDAFMKKEANYWRQIRKLPKR